MLRARVREMLPISAPLSFRLHILPAPTGACKLRCQTASSRKRKTIRVPVTHPDPDMSATRSIAPKSLHLRVSPVNMAATICRWRFFEGLPSPMPCPAAKRDSGRENSVSQSAFHHTTRDNGAEPDGQVFVTSEFPTVPLSILSSTHALGGIAHRLLTPTSHPAVGAMRYAVGPDYSQVLWLSFILFFFSFFPALCRR